MRVWFTRPDLWDCISKGIGRCTVWLEPPHFDATPVGAADPLYPHNPIGWTLPLAGEGQWQLSQRVNGLLNDHPDLALTLFDALSRSIDGQGRRDGMYQEWARLLDSDCFDDKGQREFVLEMTVPPAVWWRVARQASGAALMNANRIQAQLTSDLPF